MKRFLSVARFFFPLVVVTILAGPVVSIGAEEAGKKEATPKLLVDKHAEKNINCQGCHGTSGAPKALSSKECFKCHKSYEYIAQLTKNSKINPHASHDGNLECNVCHKVHSKSVLYCNQCHNEFDMYVP